MISCVIIDDRQKSIDVLKKMLAANFKKIEVVATANDPDNGISLIKKHDPALVFLDVVMPVKNGFEMLEELGSWDFEVIFTTGFDQYAIKSIRFSALDYLIKPIDITELSAALKRAEEKLQQGTPNHRLSNLIKNNEEAPENQKLALPTTHGYDYIPIRSIVHCKAESNYTRFFLIDNKEILVPHTLKEYDEILTPHHFFRVHHSHLINLRYVEKYLKGRGGQVIMKGGKSVNVAQLKKEELLKMLAS